MQTQIIIAFIVVVALAANTLAFQTNARFFGSKTALSANIVETAVSAGSFNTLIAAVKAAKLGKVQYYTLISYLMFIYSNVRMLLNTINKHNFRIYYYHISCNQSLTQACIHTYILY